MDKWKNSVIHSNNSLVDAVRTIEVTGIQFVLVVREDGYLDGVLTDGDIRRAILRGQALDTKVSEVMNRNPRTVLKSTSKEDMLSIMRRNVLHHLPVIEPNGKVGNFVTLDELIGASEKHNIVILMAGGLGQRLRPLTDNIPKPLLKIGGKPILENIIDSFFEQGFRNFYISVNYKAEMIIDYFGNGEKWGINIKYIQEDKVLGTAGALSLLENRPNDSFIVMNTDIITRVNFDSILTYHSDHNSLATMTVRVYDFQIPYGVVNIEGNKIINIKEKPIHKFFVNAGIYVLAPEVIDHIPKDTFFDMPTLFEKLISLNYITSAYPLREYWLDIGRIEEFERAQREWGSFES